MQTTTDLLVGKKGRVLTVMTKWLERHKTFAVVSFDSMVLTKPYLLSTFPLLWEKKIGVAGTKRLFRNGWAEIGRM